MRVCEVGEIEPDERSFVTVDGLRVGVLNVDGEYYAIQNRCEHQGGPVCAGQIRPELVGEYVEPGERVREYHGGRMTIACPWHGWEYDLETGKHLGVDDITLATFDVVVEDDTIYVEKPTESPGSQ